MALRREYLLGLVAVLIIAPVAARAQGHLRWYFRHGTVVDTVPLQTASPAAQPGTWVTVVIEPLPGSGNVVRTTRTTDAHIWAGPSVGFDAFIRESGTGAYKTGIIPGVGYGVKWGSKPDAKGNSDPWLALDLFVSGAVSEEDSTHAGADYFNIDALPVLTIKDWISVGFGPRFKVGLNGLGNVRRTLFSFGIRKAT